MTEVRDVRVSSVNESVISSEMRKLIDHIKRVQQCMLDAGYDIQAGDLIVRDPGEYMFVNAYREHQRAKMKAKAAKLISKAIKDDKTTN